MDAEELTFKAACMYEHLADLYREKARLKEANASAAEIAEADRKIRDTERDIERLRRR